MDQRVQSLSCIQLFVTPWTAARQVFLSVTNSWSLLKLMSIKSVMSSNCLILYHPLYLLPSVFPSIKVFSSESLLHIRRPKYWSFSFSNSPSWRDTGYILFVVVCFPGSSDSKASAYNVGDPGLIPGSGRSPGEGNGTPLLYSCLENPMD